MKANSPWIIPIAVSVILAVPFVAMMLTEQVNWSMSDFLVAGLLLTSLGFAGRWILSNVRPLHYKVISVLLLLSVLIIIWLELAVGIFGSPFAGN